MGEERDAKRHLRWQECVKKDGGNERVFAGRIQCGIQIDTDSTSASSALTPEFSKVLESNGRRAHNDCMQIYPTDRHTHKHTHIYAYIYCMWAVVLAPDFCVCDMKV